MKNHKTKSYIFFVLILLSFSSCLTLGKLSSPDKSVSYYNSWIGGHSYCVSGNWFEVGVVRFKADKNSFEVLDEDFAKDKKNVFFSGVPQKYVDAKSFHLEAGVPKDKSYAYHINDGETLVRIKDVDVQTFQYLKIDSFNNTWARDKNNYYFNLNKINVDYASFSFINRWFSKDKDSLYVDLYGWKFLSVKPNHTRVQAINDNYVRTDSQLLYVHTWGYIELRTLGFKDFNRIKIVTPDIIWIDNNVIYEGRKLEAASIDTESYQFCKPNFVNRFTKDREHVFYREKIIRDADPQSFVVLNEGPFSKDKSHVFCEFEIVKDADISSFVCNGYNWKDKNHKDWIQRGAQK